MKLGKGLTFSSGGEKKNTVLVVVLILVILGAGLAIGRNFIINRPKPVPPPEGGAQPPGIIPGEESLIGPIAPGSGVTIGGEQKSTPPSEAAPKEEPVQKAAAPAEKAPAAPAPPPPQAAPKQAAHTPSSSKENMREIKVFGTVSINYPASWKITAGAGNTSAVFTDGNGSFAVHAPDPKADSAKKIAQAAMKALTPGAAVTTQGTDKVSGHDAHWFAVRYKGKTARVVGIDGPTRIALVETVKSGDFAKYRDTFNKMQSAISF